MVMAVCWEEPMTAVPLSDTLFTAQPTLRDEHATTFYSSHPPMWHQPWICHDITLRLRASYCCLFFISSPPVDLSLDFAVSGFVCVCLSLCSSVLLASSERDAIVMNASVIKAMRENHPLPLKHPFKTILGIHTEAAYDGLFWGKDTV